jgi:hypothetical protein
MVKDLISMEDILILKTFFNSIGYALKRFAMKDKKINIAFQFSMVAELHQYQL